MADSQSTRITFRFRYSPPSDPPPRAASTTLPDIWRDRFRPRQAALGHQAAVLRIDAALNHWLAFAGPVPLPIITVELVDRFRAWLVQSGLGKQTARNYHISIRSLLRDLDPERFPSRRGVVIHQTAESGGTIWEHLERYLGAREVSSGYANQLRWALADLERFHGCDLGIDDLTPDLVNSWLHHMAQRGLSAETRASRRRMLLTLWRDAADLGIITPPRRIAKVGRRDRIITTWTVDQVRQLLHACDLLAGSYRPGIAKRDYWRAYVLTAWDTGLRGCDLRALPRSAIRPDGTVRLVQHKTGRRVRCRLRPGTVQAITATFPPDRELCFPTWSRLEYWQREAHRLVTLAGLTGSIGQLRHSSGTAVEREHPGRGHEHLGNTRAVFERHYLDADQVAFDRPLPPAIDVEGGEA